jgi:Glyoxalase-like domain
MKTRRRTERSWDSRRRAAEGVLELDHVFCMVSDPVEAVRRLEDDGWVLDAGQAHRGQGTRNRRLRWSGQFFELIWVIDAHEARANPLRLDRRADWKTTGASPLGLGFRGQLDPAVSDEFWLYDALGPRIWIHRDNERDPERPLVFVFEATEERTARVAHRRPDELRKVRIRGPSSPFLPESTGPPIVYSEGPHSLELVVKEGGTARPVADGLVIRS